MTNITPIALTANRFAPFGDVIELGARAFKINEGMCDRHSDLAQLTFTDGRAGISLFNAKPRTLPYSFDLVERHPLGSQAFLPMSMTPFLVIVAKDENGTPGKPQAFLTSVGQGINIHANIWHGVLTPLSEPGLFAVVDRIGESNNLEEFRYSSDYTVV